MAGTCERVEEDSVSKCQSCGSISRDDDIVCGVCGSSLQAPTTRPAAAKTEAAEGQPLPVLGLRAKKAIGVGGGITLVALAALLFGTNAAGFIVGFFVLLVGVSTIFAALSSFKEELGPLEQTRIPI